jgi:hypothetical protein
VLYIVLYLEWLCTEDVQRRGKREDNNNKIVQQVDDPNFERKLDEVIAGLQAHICNHLLTKISWINAQLIVSYILALKYEVNLSDYYRVMILMTLKQLAEPVAISHGAVAVSFKQMTTDDIIPY